MSNYTKKQKNILISTDVKKFAGNFYTTEPVTNIYVCYRYKTNDRKVELKSD